MATKNAITTYAKASVDVYFPNNEICCAMCPLLEEYQRKQCRMSGEYIADIKGVGMWCKLRDIETDINVNK